MYYRRFQNKKSKNIFSLNGRLSLTHMGGGSFYYTIPRQNKPVVGKIELGNRMFRTRFISTLIVGIAVFSLLSFFSSSQDAVPITNQNELEELETQGRFEELEERSELAKTKLYNLNNPVSFTKNGKIKIKKYKVKDGDTLSGIAQKHRVPATIIAATSKIKFHSVLQAGQQLSIPDRPGLIYKIKQGDTLASVLNKYSVKLDSFISDNANLAGVDLIEPGQNVFLPNAKIPLPPLRWKYPVRGRVSSRFGWRRHPILGYRHKHTGIDIVVNYKKLRAARTGRVIYAGYLGAYGKVIVIRHDNNFKTLYAHLSRIRVRAGSYVKQGSVIGVTGNTGRSTGAHLHFEVIKNGRPVNPRRYLRL